jgi:hypothetical protein
VKLPATPAVVVAGKPLTARLGVGTVLSTHNWLWAAKKSVPFAFVRSDGYGDALPRLTIVVPAAVPSLCQSWTPSTPSLAVKNSVPFTLVRLAGLELLATYW